MSSHVSTIVTNLRQSSKEVVLRNGGGGASNTTTTIFEPAVEIWTSASLESLMRYPGTCMSNYVFAIVVRLCQSSKVVVLRNGRGGCQLHINDDFQREREALFTCVEFLARIYSCSLDLQPRNCNPYRSTTIVEDLRSNKANSAQQQQRFSARMCSCSRRCVV